MISRVSYSFYNKATYISSQQLMTLFWVMSIHGSTMVLGKWVGLAYLHDYHQQQSYMLWYSSLHREQLGNSTLETLLHTGYSTVIFSYLLLW